MKRALRLARVCVCGHGREHHHNPFAVGGSPSVRCRWVDWGSDPLVVTAVCGCTWWRPLLLPRLRRVPLETPMLLKQSRRPAS